MPITITDDVPYKVHVPFYQMRDIHFFFLVTRECKVQFNSTIFLVFFEFLK